LFSNQRSEAIGVAWIDFNGNPASPTLVGPGLTYLVVTYVTHAWLVTDSSGDCIAIYQPLPQPGVAIIN
jgi:hypothetical protein